MKPVFTARRLSLLTVPILASPAMAANIIVNGDFSSNAAAFTSFPGYLGGSNPSSIDSWTITIISGGNVGINGPGTSVGEPFAPSATVGVDNFVFIQGGDAVVFQNLPTLLVNQEYSISVAAANRSGNPDAVGRIQIGDSSTEIYSSGSMSFTTAGFQTITATFTTPASFTGTPSIQLYGFNVPGDNTVAYGNVVLEAIPEPGACVLAAGSLLGMLLRRRR